MPCHLYTSHRLTPELSLFPGQEALLESYRTFKKRTITLLPQKAQGPEFGVLTLDIW